jgi:ATP-dependent protease Clp ATPase subunit
MPNGNCSFCGKDSSQVFRLITTDGVKICNECVGRCADLIAEEYKKIAKDIQFPKQDDDGGSA